MSISYVITNPELMRILSVEPQPLRLAIDPEVQKYEVEAILASRIQPNPPNLPVSQYKIAWNLRRI